MAETPKRRVFTTREICAITAKKLNISLTDVCKVVSVFLRVMSSVYIERGDVYLTKIGTFRSRRKGKQTYKVSLLGKAYEVPERDVPQFVFTQGMRSRIKACWNMGLERKEFQYCAEDEVEEGAFESAEGDADSV